jgi:hypothetical protein
MRLLHLASPSLLAAAFVLLPQAAHAETLTCTDLPTLPVTISQPGHYCLNKNFSQAFATAAVNIGASNVVLDCNDHAITQTGATQVSGVYASNRSAVTVRNCVIDNFGRGISFFETTAGASHGNRVTANHVRRSRIAAVQMAGTDNLVDGNRLRGNLGGDAGTTVTYGILLGSFDGHGRGNVLRGNVITAFTPVDGYFPVGIYFNDVTGTLVSDNAISELMPPIDHSSTGIYGGPTAYYSLAEHNQVMGARLPDDQRVNGIAIRFDALQPDNEFNVCHDNTVIGMVGISDSATQTRGCYLVGNTER